MRLGSIIAACIATLPLYGCIDDIVTCTNCPPSAFCEVQHDEYWSLHPNSKWKIQDVVSSQACTDAYYSGVTVEIAGWVQESTASYFGPLPTAGYAEVTACNHYQHVSPRWNCLGRLSTTYSYDFQWVPVPGTFDYIYRTSHIHVSYQAGNTTPDFIEFRLWPQSMPFDPPTTAVRVNFGGPNQT
jgi:hypothetical protein